MDQLLKFIPHALQTPKEALRAVFACSVGLFLMQLMGLDPQKVGLNPTVNLWTSAAVATVTGALITWLGATQHEKDVKQIATMIAAPAEPGAIESASTPGPDRA